MLEIIQNFQVCFMVQYFKCYVLVCLGFFLLLFGGFGFFLFCFRGFFWLGEDWVGGFLGGFFGFFCNYCIVVDRIIQATGRLTVLYTRLKVDVFCL